MVASRSEDKEDIEKLSGSVLGYKWDITKDVLGIKLSFNESKKRKGIQTAPNLRKEDMDGFRCSPHNLRGLLGICNAVYDPMGISAPFTIKLKLLMKDTLALEDWPPNTKKDWDKAVPQEIIQV